jgi:HNH/ENDO VII superfamily nuclease
VSAPEWFLPFVPLPEWARTSAPVDFQAKVERYAAWRQSNDKGFKWDGFASTTAEADQIKEAAAAQDLLPQIPVGPMSAEDHRKIQEAIAAGTLAAEPADAGNYPDFTGHVALELQLPPELWNASDAQQFRWLNEHAFGSEDGQVKIFPWDKDMKGVGGDVPPHGYTWHHHQQPGRMQLVPFGVHGAVQHSGGRQVWALSER